MASILTTSLTALTSYQRALTTVGHNIANADVEGYSRQEVTFTTKPPTFAGSGWIGSGVEVSTVERRYDEFLAAQVRTSRTSSGEAEVYYTYASQLDDLYADPELWTRSCSATSTRSTASPTTRPPSRPARCCSARRRR